jgi:hypothetical protein
VTTVNDPGGFLDVEVGGVEYEPGPSANVTLQMHDDNVTFNDRWAGSNPRSCR